MELTTKGRYAVMAMADIAKEARPLSSVGELESAPVADVAAVPLSQIAERQNLPFAYLEQIFVSLRRAGLVDSARGRAGGYRLARSAADITVGEVMRAVDEDTHFTRCADSDLKCSRDTPCLTHGLWQRLGSVTSHFFASISLADVVDGALPSAASAAAPNTAVTPSRVYLDYNATAPLLAQAKAAMLAALDVTGNPSSVHIEGRAARAVVETAREHVALLVNAKPSEVVFTSGATEANAWALAQPLDTIFLSAIEHDSVVAAAHANGAEVISVPVGRDGRVRIEEFAARVLAGAARGRALLALQLANNETGVVQDVASAAQFARAHAIAVHVDAVQAPGRIPIDFADLGADTLSLSAHKIGGPKGIGALINRDHVDLVPLIRGGGQERRRRAGTENIVGIAGFGAAARVALERLRSAAHVAARRDKLAAALREIAPTAVIVAEESPRLCNTLSVSLPGKLAEMLVIRFDLAGIAVSAGAACSSGKVGSSHVMEALGLPRDVAAGAIRISLGVETTDHDIERFIAAWKDIAGTAALAA